MKVLYYAYVLMDEDKQFCFELNENPIKNISDEGTIETQYPCIYGNMKSTKYIDGLSEIKTGIEYSSGKSSAYFSKSYENCVNFLVQKREQALKKYRDLLKATNNFYEKFSRSEIQKNIKCGVKKYSLWKEGYLITGNTSTAQYLGDFEGKSFNDACDNWAKTIDEPQYYLTGTNKQTQAKLLGM